jgi:hypothetical protein
VRLHEQVAELCFEDSGLHQVGFREDSARLYVCMAKVHPYSLQTREGFTEFQEIAQELKSKYMNFQLKPESEFT